MSESTPDFGTHAGDEVLLELADDYLRRSRAGEQPTVDEYVAKHPELADRIHELFPVMIAMEQRGPGVTVDLAPPNERVGATIGRYKLLERIGEGGFGVVYMAEQQQPVRRKVALKVVKPGMDSRQVLARFEAERQALAIMDHPNIAKVFDAGATDSGRPYFVMELVKGEPITEFCDHNQFTPQQRLELFAQVCHAVQHAHQKGIIHRDIKPTNVLVGMHDTAPVVKVIDFGVAKALGQELTDKTLFTAFAQFLGTPLYMSPEQAGQSVLDVDTRSDIYSLGVLLYELVTGTTPFAKERFKKAAEDEIRRIIREEEPPKPSTRLSQSNDSLASVSAQRHTEPAKLAKLVRGELDWIVMRSLEKDRKRRYQTASGLADDIERFLSDQPVAACPPSAGYRLKKFIRRNRSTVVASAAISLALIVGLIATTVGLLHARRQTEIARTQALRSEQVAKFLQNMLQSAGPSVARGRDATLLRELLDKTAQRIGSELKGQPLLEAELRHTIGWVYSALGEFRQAELMHREAAELRIKLLGREHPDAAESLWRWSGAMWEVHDFAEAEKVGREALAIQRKALGDSSLSVANSLHLLGYRLSTHSRPTEGEPLIREALAILRKRLDIADPSVGVVLSSLAASLWRQNKLAEAEEYSREAVSIHRRAVDIDPLLLADTLGDLSKLLKQQGKLQEAESARRENLEIRRKLLPARHWDVINSLEALGELLQLQNKLPETTSNHREQLALLREIVDADPKDHHASNRLAWKLIASPGRQLDEPILAIELAEKCVDAEPENARYWNTLGTAYYRAGQWPAAIEAITRSIELNGGGNASGWFFRAMAHWQLGQKPEARQWYDKAVDWTDHNQPINEEVRRLRDEAAELLRIKRSSGGKVLPSPRSEITGSRFKNEG